MRLAPGNRGPSTVSLRDRIATTARAAGMALCGAGCMGFVNVGYGLRAIGYQEPDQLPAGPVALVTQSGSVFSAMLRTRRALGYTVAVSSGQELVTTAAQYARYALDLPQTRVLALVLEAMRDAAALRQVLEAAAVRQIPVVLLTAGRSAAGRALVTAHSGALAGADGAWEALADAYGVHRVADLAELTDTLELFTIGRRAAPGPRGGIATVHDSGLERAHIADLAADLGVPFASDRRGHHCGGWPRCSTRAWSRATRWTCGARAPRRSGSSPSRSPRWPATRPSPRSRSRWTW